MKEKDSGLICVGCGGNATKGSMKLPYCKKCYKEKFNNNYEKYNEFLNKTLYGSSEGKLSLLRGR